MSKELKTMMQSHWKMDSEIILPDNLIEIDAGLFSEHKQLQKIVMPTSIQKIGSRAFSGCSSLVNINLPESLLNIGDKSFCDCKNLCNISFPKSLTRIGDNAFNGCTLLTDVYLPESITKIGSRAFANCSNLHNVYIPTLNTEFGEKVFDGCDDITIHCAFGSAAMEYAINKQHPFDLDMINVGNRDLIPLSIDHNISGSGWEWDSKTKTLTLTKYDGGAIIAGEDITICLSDSSKNYISPQENDLSRCGLVNIGGTTTISGGGELMIEKYDTGIFVNDSLTVDSGIITTIGKKYGIYADSGCVNVIGGTLSAASLSHNDDKPGIVGKIRSGDARIFAGKSLESPKEVQHYFDQSYVCITHDVNYSIDTTRIVHQTVYNIGDNSQVITGDNYGVVIGKDNIINRSSINKNNTLDNEKASSIIHIDEGNVINHSVIATEMEDKTNAD